MICMEKVQEQKINQSREKIGAGLAYIEYGTQNESRKT
jgi:hypothetical protein